MHACDYFYDRLYASSESNEAYGVHKSGTTTKIPGETCSQEVDLKSNNMYGVRGEVQVAAINGTTDAVYYSVIGQILERQ